MVDFTWALKSSFLLFSSFISPFFYLPSFLFSSTGTCSMKIKSAKDTTLQKS